MLDGERDIYIDRPCNNGIYLVRLRTNKFNETQKVFV